VLFVVTILSHLPFTSRFLYHYDSVQFALALEKYDVYLHQPHPPGYFLYVMAGKLLDHFIQDANTSFVAMSVVASGLTVIAIYYLARAIFNENTAWWAGWLAVTSPLLWFYGEVALSYIVAAFFNAWIALLCWQLLHSERKRAYLSAVLLGIGGGIRQDLLMFLFPLWIFCIATLEWRKFVTALVILGVTVAGWFVPMLLISGGRERYFAAVNQFWEFHYSQFPIWNAAAPSRLDTILTILGFASYGIGIGVLFIVLGCYASLRTGHWRLVDKNKRHFFILWFLPAIVFHCFIFILPYNHAYGVFFLPALFVLLPPLVEYVFFELQRVGRFRNVTVGHIVSGALGLVVAINAGAFLLSSLSYSARSIREHDRNLSIILTGIKTTFPSENTIVLDFKSSIFYGYRHIQYYLPDYQVYLVDLRVNERGERWHIFGAVNGRTVLADAVHIPTNIRYIIYVMDPSDEDYKRELQRYNLNRLSLKNGIVLYYRKIIP